MEEIIIEPQKTFEDLSKEQRKQLRGEFNNKVEFRFKMFFGIGIVLLLSALVSGGFSIYYMINIFFNHVVPFQFYICAAMFTIGLIFSLLLTSIYHKKFRAWLKESKKILTRANTKNN